MNPKISFLVDTNIFIQMEDASSSGIIREPFADFSRLANQFGISLYLHPRSIKEIEKDRDQKRKKETLSKVKKYPLIENPPEGSITEIEEQFGGISSENDLVDCQLLYALKEHCINYLVTEDNHIHKRAKQDDISDRVFSIAEAKNLILNLYRPQNVLLPHITEEFVYSLKKKDPIFNSLRKDYSGFDDWLDKCSSAQRKAWVIYENSEIKGICIYKHETEKEYDFIDYPSLKLCTYKISEKHRGEKLGELLLKKVFLYSQANNFHSCWMTVYGKHGYLIEFIKKFGFIPVGSKQSNELIFKKQFKLEKNLPDLSPLDFHIRYAPAYLDNRIVKKHIVPIKEMFHNLLFPEKQRQFQLPIQKIPGNTIRKVYLCHASTKKIKEGDLLFFYVSSPIQAIVSLGIVESTHRLDNLSKILSIIGKRSVYSLSDIQQMSKKELLILNFRFIRHFKSGISLKKLKEKEISSTPQSISELQHDNYLKLKKLFNAP